MQGLHCGHFPIEPADESLKNTDSDIMTCIGNVLKEPIPSACRAELLVSGSSMDGGITLILHVAIVYHRV